MEKIACARSLFFCEKVHLHVRGENKLNPFGIFAQVGSSPRAWRKWNFESPGKRTAGFISTCVEKICHGDFAKSRTRGSSPRAWRKFLVALAFAFHLGFISTCVEKIPCFYDSSGIWWVHLHVRGENASVRAHNPDLIGSSPRAWRKFFRASFERASVMVHLHVRGENHRMRRKREVCGGSSPRAWRKYWRYWFSFFR